jgi:uncharacterized phosphosugar-binding protein
VTTSSGIQPDYGDTMARHLADVRTANTDTLEVAADLLFHTVEADGLIYAAGTGHSVAMCLETFYRAGGLACVYPLYQADLLPLHGAMASSTAERTAGAGTKLVAALPSTPGADDVAVVFSNSGVNHVPVEIATALRERGVPVIAVSSVPHMSRVEPRAGVRLGDVANVLLDTRAPYGDAGLTVGAARTAALSSLTSVYLWNLLLAELARRAEAAGVTLPLWRSGNMPGGDAANAALLDRYRPRVPML